MKHLLLLTFFIPILASAAEMKLTLNFSLGTDTMTVVGGFNKTSSTPLTPGEKSEYELVSGSLKTYPSAGFSNTVVDVIQKADYKVTLTTTNTQKTLKVAVTHSNSSQDPFMPPKVMTLTQTGDIFWWTKDEGPIKTTQTGEGCVIKPNGKQPTFGVYAVVLTEPSPCEFKMPSVKVGHEGGELVSINIGSYWNVGLNPPPGPGPGPGPVPPPPRVQRHTIAKMDVAHDFPVVDVPNGPFLDNGFILVGPDHYSYLLVDAGLAFKDAPEYKSAQTIASQISQSLGYGSTKLMQPSPGKASDGFATATLFKKGSVVAIYDDTPDMSGKIEVKALVDNIITQELKLKWDAKLNARHSIVSR